MKIRESFGNHYVLVLLYLDMLTINLGLSNERVCNAKLALSFTMWKKVRLYAFTFLVVIYGIACCTLLNNIHVGARITDDD